MDNSKSQAATASITIGIDTNDFSIYNFEGSYRPSINLQFYGMFDSCISISNVCTQIALELVKFFPDIGLHSYTGRSFFDESLVPYNGMNRAAPVALFFGVPENIPDFVFEHPITIGGFVCETTAIPKRWVDVCNRFDLLVVPSEFCKSAFENSGVSQPIMVVQHGLEPEYHARKTKKHDDVFYFYNTFNGRLFPERKGCADLIECFSRAFSNRDDVRLKLRTEPTDRVLESIKQFHAEQLIEIVIPGSENTDTFAALYSDVHCTVHPSRGEGFGLIPFQSIACETPVIAPCHSGMTEYLNNANALLVDFHEPCHAKGVYYGTGRYWPVDKEDLVKKMLMMVDQWDEEYLKVKKIAPTFRQQYSWPVVLSELIAYIQEKQSETL